MTENDIAPVTVEDVIKIESLPIIEEQIDLIRKPLEKRLAEILSLDCTEETRREVEKERAELRKTRAAFASSVAEVKLNVFRPWCAVEDKAKETIKLMDEADGKLKQKIDAVKNALQAAKAEEVKAYYNEKRESLGLSDFFTYEKMNLRIGLSDTMKSLYNTVDAYLEKIDSETSVMLTLPDNSAIIAEYKENGLNLQKAIETVRNRKAAEEAEKNRIEEITQRNADEAKRAESVQKAAEPYFEAPRTVTPETKEIRTEQPEKRYTMKFNVKGTMEQLKSLKRYIESAGIEIIE